MKQLLKKDFLTFRSAGVLLHPTSLPSGKLDEHVFSWIDFMAEAGLSVWQMLPLGVPQAGRSPYQCESAFACNPDLLPDDFMATEQINSPAYLEWLEAHASWVDDFALFMTLQRHFSDQPWFCWPEEFRQRDVKTLISARDQHRTEIDTICWQQYRFYCRWKQVKAYAADRNIALFGDIPIFVAHNSADVWSHRECFLLNEKGQPDVVTGVPPDYFCKEGQRWGNPHYDWKVLQANKFDWWVKRIGAHFEHFDLVRIDHFRGLQAVWAIDSRCDTAVEGEWWPVPGDELLNELKRQFGQNLPLVAEDLGTITSEVTALRQRHHLPGMSVLQFSFDHFDDNPHKPHNIKPETVVYTGTHDNDTTLGWFMGLEQHEQQHVVHSLGLEHAGTLVDSMIQQAFATEANLAIIPMQDFLYLGSEARMNTPATIEGNWMWRYQDKQINSSVADRIRQQLEQTGRLLNNET